MSTKEKIRLSNLIQRLTAKNIPFGRRHKAIKYAVELSQLQDDDSLLALWRVQEATNFLIRVEFEIGLGNN